MLELSGILLKSSLKGCHNISADSFIALSGTHLQPVALFVLIFIIASFTLMCYKAHEVPEYMYNIKQIKYLLLQLVAGSPIFFH